MLMGKITKYGAGLTLLGDYNDLVDLHETIHYLSDCSYLTYEQQEFVLSLAYEVRKAYSDARDEQTIGFEEKLIYKCTNILLPELLFNVFQLRHCASYKTTNAKHQANLYRLEYLIEEALLTYDIKIGAEVFYYYKKISPLTPDFINLFVTEICYEYAYQNGTGKARFKKLPNLIKKLTPYGQGYKKFHDEMHEVAKEKETTPNSLFDNREWAEIKW